MTHPGDKAAAVVDRLRAAAQTDEGDAYDVCNLAAAEIERLTAENERLRAEIADMKRQKMIDEESDALAGYGWRDVD